VRRAFARLVQRAVAAALKRHPGSVARCCPNAAGDLVRHQRMGKVILGYVEQFPRLHMEANVQPISR